MEWTAIQDASILSSLIPLYLGTESYKLCDLLTLLLSLVVATGGWEKIGAKVQMIACTLIES